MSDETAEAPVLVTGGSGFIGTNVIEALLEAGRRVVNLDTAPPRNPRHRQHWIDVDLVDEDAVRRGVAEAAPAEVLHLGARTDLRGETPDDYRANTTGTANLLAALKGLSAPPRLIAASTRMVLPIGYQPTSDLDVNPPNAYGASKVEAERILREADYPGTWAIVRPTSIWGPWFDVPYRDFFLTVAKGRYRHPGKARIHKSFGYVENTVAQLQALLTAPHSAINGRVFYLADYEPIEVLDWAREIREATSPGTQVKSVPLPVLHVAAKTGDVLERLGWNSVPLSSFRLDNLLTEMVYDLAPLQGVLPTLPTSRSEGVLRTVAWMRDADLLPKVASTE